MTLIKGASGNTEDIVLYDVEVFVKASHNLNGL